MDIQKKITGAAIAAAVALTFCAAPIVSASAASGLVICPGVNSCKGQSACQTTTNTCKVLNHCKGQNDCKGRGFLMLSKAECVKRGSHGVTYGVPSNAVNSQPYTTDSSEN